MKKQKIMKFRKNSFCKQVYDTMKGKGWFEVKDILDMYLKFRNISKEGWRYIYMSGDASWNLKLMCDTGTLERKVNPNHKSHYLYRVMK